MKNLIIVLAGLLIGFISCQKTTIEPNETEQPTLQTEEQETEPQTQQVEEQEMEQPILQIEEQETPETGSTNLLLGKWSITQYNAVTFTFERVDQFHKDRAGLAFETAPKMIEWTSGFCGTPPLHFFEMEGIYKYDNILSVITWSERNFKILECTETSLILEELD